MGQPSRWVRSEVLEATIVEHLMKSERKVRIKDVRAYVPPRVGRSSALINDDLGELLVELVSKFRRNSQGFDIAGVDAVK